MVALHVIVLRIGYPVLHCINFTVAYICFKLSQSLLTQVGPNNIIILFLLFQEKSCVLKRMPPRQHWQPWIISDIESSQSATVLAQSGKLSIGVSCAQPNPQAVGDELNAVVLSSTSRSEWDVASNCLTVRVPAGLVAKPGHAPSNGGTTTEEKAAIPVSWFYEVKGIF